jgi:WD40 repeat protein
MLMRIACFLVAISLSHASASAVELRQVISREHPAIAGTGQGLAVGGDGSIYVYGGKDGEGYVLRISRDGRQKFATKTTYAITGVAARADGTFATSNAHFAKSVSVYDREGRELGTAGGFTGNDAVGWDSPGTIEPGSSGDFFALDQHVGRIVRLNAAGEIVRSYPLPGVESAAGAKVWPYGFRVHEPSEQFYFIVGQELQCRGFDGQLRWSVPSAIGGDPWGGFSGGFDVDESGLLFLNSGTDPQVRIFDAQGNPAGELALAMGDRAADPQRRISHLRVLKDELLIRQKSDTEVFQAYDRSSGAFRHAVDIEHEQLTVSYPDVVWTSGASMPFEIRFDSAGRDVQPRLGAWLRPLGTVRFAPLNVANDQVSVPVDASGLFQLRVCSGLEGCESEYQLDSVIEVRPSNAVGSVSIFTPLNRRWYVCGESIPFAVRCRTGNATVAPVELEINLTDANGNASATLSVPVSGVEASHSEIAGHLTSTLAPGEYRLTTNVAGWTVAEQYLSLGDGADATQAPFYRVRHGDYSLAYPDVTFFNAPERIARHVLSADRIGENLFVDRLGHNSGLGELSSVLREGELIARLEADPIAVAPEKAEFENRILQTIAAYGALGIEQRAILLYMDAGLPLGTGFDQRAPEVMERDVESATRLLSGYPAFGGWSWAANWWIEKRGADMAVSPEERAAYEGALKAAQETGRWDPVLETVSDRWINHAVTAESRLSGAMRRAEAPREGGRRLVSAMTAPYRQPGIIPTITFANADEVDLHFQAEQIQWPMISAHNVDFYQRPGRPAWGHPELWNDDGTGAQILSNSLQMVMRGADGIGQSGSTKGFVSPATDPRGMGPGATSVHRALNEWLAAYGPWLASCESSDPIAIPVSTRMMRLDLGWQGVGGLYFTRLFEAYNACLRAHRPAGFVFAEDCTPERLTEYRGVLLVSQTVELDPALQAALEHASQSGIPIYCDRTCRVDLLANFPVERIGPEFTRIEREHHVLNDDSAFWRYRNSIISHAESLEHELSAVPAVAECDHPEVLLTERRQGDIRVLWAVNDAAVPYDPGHLWRVSLASGSRMPVLTELRWPAAEGCVVYELFSGEQVETTAPLTVDLRHAPARVFVAIPENAGSAALSDHVTIAGGIPAVEPFAARLRDICISRNGQSALVTAAGWDRNACIVDLRTGEIVKQDRVGHHFAYAPQATDTGFAVQGFDLNSAEGYHLYLLNHSPAANDRQRFALYGLPKRGTTWASARLWQEPVNQFAVDPGGRWVAAGGDLGLAVWSSNGALRWSDDWWPDSRRRPLLARMHNEALLVLEADTATARNAADGRILWTHRLGGSGILTGAVATSDGSVVAVRSTNNGGRIFILRDGTPVNSLATGADESVLSPDGALLAATWQNELRLFDTSGGLLWRAAADDVLRSPRFDPAGQRIAVGSETGTLYVFDVRGSTMLERDVGALPVVAWLDDGGLVVATWLGRLARLDAQFESVWSTIVQSDTVLEVTPEWPAIDTTLTTRVAGWGNAASETAALTPNLLAETTALIEAWCEPTTHGDPRSWRHNIDQLRDGNPKPPHEPWLEWSDISYLDSGWRQKLVVQVDTFRSQLHLRGVTIAEDPEHPESWTRDMRLQWWDATGAAWRDGPYLLHGGASPESAVHTHWFDEPLEAARFRFVSTGGGSWPVGNLRWGELVFHGEVLGPSHPDAVANRPVAVLFDEQETDLKNLMAYGDYPFALAYDDASSGGKCLALTRAGTTAPYWKPPFGHVLPNWDFTIVEHPEQPGEYRWLEFAWKADSAGTTGLSLRVGPHHGGGVSLSAGEATPWEGAINVEQAAAPPAEWQTVRVDLWELHRREPFSIRSLSLGSTGGGGRFDRVRLARDPEDLSQ